VSCPLFEKSNTLRSGLQVKQSLHLDYTSHKFGQQNFSTDPYAIFHVNPSSNRSYQYVRSADPVQRMHKNVDRAVILRNLPQTQYVTAVRTIRLDF
jgi:hypothetical protein